MKELKNILLVLIVLTMVGCKNENSNTEATVTNNEIESEANTDSVDIIPISHGTLILETENQTIYIDPTGGSESFLDQNKPTLVLITDIHGDHLNIETLKSLNLEDVTIIAPVAVVEKLTDSVSKSIITLNNGENYNFKDVNIEAIPMYNLREEALKYHTKGRGNGYIITLNNEKVYISGDTEDIPEMRELKNIDKAFICMNLPYTMTIESAASAVLDFKPTQVYPYHYRGTEGLSDIEKFKSLVNEANPSIEVILLDWY